MAMKSLFDLTDQVAVVTGSSRGIGRAIAENLAAQGAKVVISSRKAGPCEEVAKAINDAGGTAVAIPCNISHKDQCEALVSGSVKEFGRLDHMICNAASNPYYGPLGDIEDEVFMKIMQNNILSNLWLCTMAGAHIAGQGGGTMQIVSSIGGMRGNRMLGAYNISKAADMQLVRNLAAEWGPKNIRVNAIAPGLIKTDFARALWENPDLLKMMESQSPLGRIGEPDDIGGVAVFLASAAGNYTTGQVLVADGGVTVCDAVG
ncbi:MAG: glucose 1-dehydrogenase [Chromatiales bacterium]|jgi:NAD(P)-dependent dehydrogenase (short-subunit alcohol dehydrogenase family)